MKHTPTARLLAVLLSVLLLLGLSPAAAARPAPEAILQTPSYPEIVLFNSDLERGDDTWWELTGVKSNPIKRLLYDLYNNSYFLNLRPADADDPEMHASYTVELDPGTYCFTFDLCGRDTGSNQSGLAWSVRADETVLAAQTGSMFTYGRTNWHSYQTDSFTLTEAAEVTFDFGGTPYSGSYWARLDNLRLYGTGGLAFEPYLDWISLENGDLEGWGGGWGLTGLSDPFFKNSSSSWNDSRMLKLWVSDTQPADIAVSYTVTLTQGYYDFAFEMDGAAGDSGLSWSVVSGGHTLCQGGPLVTAGWDEWQEYTTDPFVLNRTAEVTFTLSGTLPAGYWAHLDNLRLDGTGIVFRRLSEIVLPNGDFELGDGSCWELDGYDDSCVVENTGSNANDSYVLSLWKSNTQTMFVRAAYYLTLTPGTYQFTFDFEGENICSTLQAIVHEVGGSCHYETDYLETTGWDEWTTYESNVFEIFETTRLYFEIVGELQAGYWGHLDNLRLYGTGSIYGGLPPMQTDDGNFDYGGSYWSISGFSSPTWNNDSLVNSSYSLPLWISDEEDAEASASYLMHLLPGSYELSYDLEGKEGMSGLQAVVSALGSELPEGNAVLREGETVLYESGELETHGFDQWETHRSDSFTLAQPGWVKFELCGTVPAGYWGHFDNLKLWGDGDFYPENFDHDPTLAVPQVRGVDEYEFVRGADISSFYSLIRAGAQFYDYYGNLLDEEGFFNLLSRAGFNYVRIRVWVDPYDALGNGYGGGNNDLVTARYLAKLATDAGLRVLIDFHYSDFWADPGKQLAPKAWASYSLQQKADAIEEYTYNSLKSIKQHADGMYVDMVQIGNETTTGVCGETGWANMAELFAAGARAVRRLDEERMEETKVTLHFTNPERTSTIKGFADTLNQYNVDYDVFATSWYPYWHGTAENLTEVLSYVADTYDKQVLVAETSWAWTLDDGDGWDNTVSPTGNSSNMPYAFTQQGQADELVAAAQAVRAVGEKGLGVFYWENAWIPVQYAYDANGDLDQTILASNQNAWETYGCGWASSYAGEYQTDAAQWHGGSAVDNQAMFDFHGQALDSLWTWYYMMFGTEELFAKQVQTIETVSVETELGGSFSLPQTVKVTYNVGDPQHEAVAWDETELAAVDLTTPGVYTVHGVVTLSYGLGTGETTATITVVSPNLLQNPGFEDPDLSMYEFDGNYDRSTDTPHSGDWCLHFYDANGGSLWFYQLLTLEPGTYSFSFYAQGDAMGSTDQFIDVELNGDTYRERFALAGWANWQHPEMSFTIYETCSVGLGVSISYGAGGWGTVDDLRLIALPDSPAEPVFEDVGTDAWYYDAVLWAVQNGVTAGTSETTFSPGQSCTRAQIVTFLWRAEGSPGPEAGTLAFTDVPTSAWYHDAVAWAVQNGISTGVSPSRFSPKAVCTRAQAVTMLWRAAGSPAPAAGGVEFEDVAASAWYHDAVAWAVQNGITIGTSKSAFSPNQNCSRAEIVTFLYQYYGN